MRADSGIAQLLRLLDEAYDETSWHGPNQRNIWEITLHAAYWKYVVVRRFTGEKRGGFPRTGSDWFARPSKDSTESWTEDVKLLDDVHGRLRTCVELLNPAELDSTPG